jgi:hypothetical protein
VEGRRLSQPRVASSEEIEAHKDLKIRERINEIPRLMGWTEDLPDSAHAEDRPATVEDRIVDDWCSHCEAPVNRSHRALPVGFYTLSIPVYLTEKMERIRTLSHPTERSVVEAHCDSLLRSITGREH